MRAAVMQPYLFPYIGYYQLVSAVDEFIFFDDVNFIKKGYINRNAIFSAGTKLEFSLPVSGVSQNRKINQHAYAGEYSKFLKQVSLNYSKAPFFKEIYSLVESVLLSGESNVAIKNSISISAVFDYLGITKAFSFSSELSIPEDVRAQERIIQICKEKSVSEYVNAIGGMELYDKESFLRSNISLLFIRSTISPYPQLGNAFVSHLSMIDVLMWNSPEAIKNMLGEYELV